MGSKESSFNAYHPGPEKKQSVPGSAHRGGPDGEGLV